MEVEDYGDISHKHTHIHSVPKIHQKTLDIALKDWCMNVYNEDKCKSLNVSHFNEIMSGSNQEVSMSEVYAELLKMEQIKAVNGSIKIHINGTQIILEHDEEVYKSEIIIDFSEREFFGYLNMPKKIFDTLNPPNNQDERFVMVKIILDEDNFKLILGDDEIDAVYETNIKFRKDDFLSLLGEMDLDQILNENENLIDNIDNKKKEIDREKILIPDKITPQRRLNNLEKIDSEVLKQLIILSIYFLIGLLFGIYLIYFFFIIELK